MFTITAKKPCESSRGEVASFVLGMFPMYHVTFFPLFIAVKVYTSIHVYLKLNRISAEYSYWRQFVLGEEIEEKEKANSPEIEKKSSKEPVKVQPDVCETPAPPADPVPIPYPNTDRASDTSSGSKTVKTEGKALPVKEDFKKSVGDESGTSDDESEIGFLKELAKTKVLGGPLWIWGLLVVAVIVVLWILSSSSPIEPVEYFSTL